MKTDDLLVTTAQVTVTMLDRDVEPCGTMIMPPNTVVRVDLFEPADRSVGIFTPTVVLELGRLSLGVFHPAGILCEPLDTVEAFGFAPVASQVRAAAVEAFGA